MAEALVLGKSLRHAAQLLGVKDTWLRYRALRDPLLVALFRQCVARGNEMKSRYVRARRSAN
jgi:hypothetical protein